MDWEGLLKTLGVAVGSVASAIMTWLGVAKAWHAWENYRKQQLTKAAATARKESQNEFAWLKEEYKDLLGKASAQISYLSQRIDQLQLQHAEEVRGLRIELATCQSELAAARERCRYLEDRVSSLESGRSER